MAYDEQIAERVRACIAGRDGVTEQKMFGGIAFMLAGKMFCGVVKSDLMVRVGPDSHDAALAKPGARAMDFTGRPARGMVYVGPDGIATDKDLADWLNAGLDFARSLPAKQPMR